MTYDRRAKLKEAGQHYVNPGVVVKERSKADRNWWSLRPLAVKEPSAANIPAEWAANPIDPDCENAVNDPKLTLSLYPDAKAGGLAVQPGDFAHVIAACADTNVIPTATLRPLGVDAGLLDAIDAAHGGGFFDKDLP